VPESVRRVLEFTALAVLLVLGGALRLYNINWDQFQHVHPDERWIVWVADTMSWPRDLGAALDPQRSTLDPLRWPPGAGDLAGQSRAYAYGHFPLYLLVGTAHLAQSLADWMGTTTIALPAVFQPLHAVGRHLAEYDYLPLVGRAISALCDLATLLLVFVLGHRAFGRTAGLLAAGFYAIAVLPIQLSHFFAVDLVLTLCVVLTVTLAARWAERGGWATWILAGICAGLAVGSKFSAVMLGLPLLVAALWRLPQTSPARKVASVLGRLAAVGAAGLLSFALTNPFAFIEARAYLSNIVAQQAMVSGAWDVPYTLQYIGTLPYWYDIQQLAQWGLGWPLGLLAWGGLAWLAVRALRRRATPAQLVILAWMLPYVAVTGAFHAKFLRYMAPLVPFLLICGGGAAVAAYHWIAARWSRRGRIGFGAAAAVLLVLTAAWTAAFMGVYRHEHPWIRASRWIYQNVPPNSRLLTEHWDDALPLTLDGVANRPPFREYQRDELPLYDPDTSEKLDTLVSELAAGDYLVVASNRLAGPIMRLPGRYPMTSQYYRLLFDGQLGYEEVAEFSNYPALGSVTIRDDRADESFTVYDHPRVTIFANTDRLKPALLRARLERYLPLQRPGQGLVEPRDAFVSISAQAKPPGHARYLPPDDPPDQQGVPGALPSLALDQPVGSLPVVADFRWNRFASEWPPAAVLAWWIVLSLFGLVAWPLIYPVMGGLRDRGFGIARVAGWLLIGWVHWVGVSLGLWQNRTWVIAIIVLAGGAAASIAWWKQRDRIGEFLAARRKLLLAEEAVFALAFLAFVAIRLLNPDLWQPWNGGEKFMESAFLNAILRSPAFPPYDPYFAGGYINYYYYGLYLVSLPIKLTGIASEVAFNLAIPGLFALSAVGAVSVCASLSRRDDPHGQGDRIGTLGVVLGAGLALLASNLTAFSGVLRSAKKAGEGLAAVGRFLSARGYDYWAPSRVIPYSINEFPLWTFVFADLHPHLVAIPFGLLVIALSFNWLRTAEGEPTRMLSPGDGDAKGPGPEDRLGVIRASWSKPIMRVLLLALALGAMGVINTWDLPTYSLLAAAAFLLAGWRKGGIKPLALGALGFMLTGLLALVAYRPFYVYYSPLIARSTGSLLARYLNWTHQGSPLNQWLSVWGILLFLAYGLALMAFLRHPPGASRTNERSSFSSASDRGVSDRARVIGMLALLALAALLAAVQRPAAALAVIPLVLMGAVALRKWLSAEVAFLSILAALGLGILVGLELVYVRDFLEGSDWYRMNTVFKLSVPAWLFLGLALGVMLGQWWEDHRISDDRMQVGARSLLRWFWRVAVVGMLVVSSAFLLFGIHARVLDRFPGRRPAIGTLDGTAYMTVGTYTWPDPGHVIELAYDYQAIHWMLGRLQGSQVVAEAPAGGYQVDGTSQAYDYYRAGGLRVASLTGFPTFVGQHENEQRPAELVGQRVSLGQEFFATTDVERTLELARQLGVRYIYVGALERILFSQASLDKFDAMVERGELEVLYRNPQVVVYQVTSGA
jgi:YYY domain-containing protein